MNKRLSKKQMWFKQFNPTKDDKMYVGIDVHKESCSVPIWLNDAPAIDFVTPADNQPSSLETDAYDIKVKSPQKIDYNR